MNNHDLQLFTDAFKGKKLKEVVSEELVMVSQKPSGCMPPKQQGNLGNACLSNDTKKERDH